MIVFSGGILLEYDEVKTNSVAGEVPVVSHRNIHMTMKVIRGSEVAEILDNGNVVAVIKRGHMHDSY